MIRFIVETRSADGSLYDIIEQDSTARGRMSFWLSKLVARRTIEGLKLSIATEVFCK